MKILWVHIVTERKLKFTRNKFRGYFNNPAWILLVEIHIS